MKNLLPDKGRSFIDQRKSFKTWKLVYIMLVKNKIRTAWFFWFKKWDKYGLTFRCDIIFFEGGGGGHRECNILLGTVSFCVRSPLNWNIHFFITSYCFLPKVGFFHSLAIVPKEHSFPSHLYQQTLYCADETSTTTTKQLNPNDH
jgi:hypothetical protein